jgi:hypothetical protein
MLTGDWYCGCWEFPFCQGERLLLMPEMGWDLQELKGKGEDGDQRLSCNAYLLLVPLAQMQEPE